MSDEKIIPLAPRIISVDEANMFRRSILRRFQRANAARDRAINPGGIANLSLFRTAQQEIDLAGEWLGTIGSSPEPAA